MFIAKLWTSFLLFILVFAALLANLNGFQIESSLTRELQNIEAQGNPLHYLSIGFQWLKHKISTTSDLLSSSSQDANTNSIPLAADLSTCHKSLSDADAPLYCCPPRREADEPVIDFEFPSPSEPKRIRRPAHRVADDEEYLAKYEKAIAIMKQYSYDDPFNYLRQANMHCIYCTGAYNQLNSSALFKIHRSWLFFPWHRIFIYFHERFIGKLIGDDTFALPYWNWDHPDGMVIPTFYYRPGAFLDKDRERSHHPPEVVDDSFDYVEKGLGPEEQVASNLAFMYHQMVSGAKKTELFMGCQRRFGKEGECDGPGTIEVAPHNALHTWVGNTDQPERENMGAFYSAARDPIFYAHHANIDRLWTVWKQLRGGEPEFVDPVWLDSYFYFHNENRQLVRIKVRDCLDIDKLGYAYEEAELPWLNARPKPSVPPKFARQVLKMRDDKYNNGLLLPGESSFAASSDFGPEGRRLGATVRAKVHRPKRYRSETEKEEEEVLVVYGINIEKDMYVKFDVFVNAIDETMLGPEEREFAGTFVNMRHGARVVLREGDTPAMGKISLKLGISELLEDLEAEEEESIWVSVVPKGNTGVNTTIGGIRIEYMR